MFRSVFCLAALVSFVVSIPVKREVPQEHSHNKFLAQVKTSLNLNNPDKIVDTVFGLLGNAAAAAGLGNIKDPDCLQQATADQAFTNAKKAGDVNGQVSALIYRALERNTQKVGLPSVKCTSIKAVNPEIAAIQQHQDPASPNAAATNKAIVLALAKQIKSVGGDPQLALQSGTFAPGNLNDNTGKGNTCDDANDQVGCIFTQKLLVNDATAAEIDAAVGGAQAASGSSSSGSGASKSAGKKGSSSKGASTGSCPAAVTVTVTAGNSAATPAAAPSTNNAATQVANTGKLNFGKCTDPSVIFAAGLPGRKATEFAFEPHNLQQFNHGTALNPNIIYQFQCDNLVNSCGLTNADSTVVTCRAAQTKAAALGETGASADSFNGALGFKTNFAALDAQAAADKAAGN